MEMTKNNSYCIQIPIIFTESVNVVLLLTFIGPANHSSPKDDVPIIDDTFFNVEYQGDNIIGYFDCNRNQIGWSSTPIWCNV